ncbi:MAG: cytochrome c family protein [Bacteroidota bacterium]|nr:cytochrome c family protein [Bacteroidota bacterium]
MVRFRKIRKSYFVIALFLTIIYFGNVMTSTLDVVTANKGTGISNKDGNKFAGSAACASCHKDIYESHIKTAHYLDSRPASKKFIKGSFLPGKNKFVYNKWMEVVLEQKKDSLFQTAFINGVEYESKPFGVVIGSGRKGQSYLYWDDNKLFQLPVSYYTNLNSWCNSPGFPINFVKFDRIIPAECLECHGTYAKFDEDENHEPFYDKSQIIYGIDCERCHGAAANHVAYQLAHPDDKSAKYILNIKQLSRQQRLDGCALCHSGFRNAVKPRFTFTIGDTLDNYSHPRYNADSISTLDVHGNQYGLLMASKCFKMSQLDCSSCHNVHVNEANSPKIFSQRCIACHSDVQHNSIELPLNKKVLFNNNCIDCHMPMLPSHKIVLTVDNADNAIPDLVRTHKVGIYPEKTKEILEKIKSMN